MIIVRILHALRLLRAASITLALPAVAIGQTQCRTADANTAARLTAVEQMMTSADSRWVNLRQSYRLPVVDDTAIAIVSDPTTCARAASALNATLPVAAQRSARTVYVIRVGPTRFVVWDRDTAAPTASEFIPLVVLDDSFAVLARFAA